MGDATDGECGHKSGLRTALPVVGYLLFVFTMAYATGVILDQSGLATAASPSRLGVSDDRELDVLLLAIETADGPTLRRMLARANLDVNQYDKDSLTPLLRAARAGWADGCRLLLQRGARVNDRDDQRRTPMHFAMHVPGPAAC